MSFQKLKSFMKLLRGNFFLLKMNFILFRWKKDISKITNYKDLPQEAKDYLRRVEELLGVPVTWIGVGPEREAIITKDL